MQTFIMTHYACFQVIKPCDDCKQNNARKECYLVCYCRQSGVDGLFEPGSFFIVFHKTLCQVEIWRLILQSRSSDKLACNDCLMFVAPVQPPGVDVIGSRMGVNVVDSVSIVGVGSQSGTMRRVPGVIDSVFILFVLKRSAFE